MSASLTGQILAVDVKFVLEYEHLLMYAGDAPAKQVRTHPNVLAGVLAVARKDNSGKNEAATSAGDQQTG